ncbi:unnamed protein product [Pleuronectes platessa]|uniref:Uncharacterized protein n=1 Tax=Pleuronectes platessa TaxID=8262 RepID=A0A9N7YTM0_PLEPL|nr:unnamed protein product [Pleuronectes platessa]
MATLMSENLRKGGTDVGTLSESDIANMEDIVQLMGPVKMATTVMSSALDPRFKELPYLEKEDREQVYAKLVLEAQQCCTYGPCALVSQQLYIHTSVLCPSRRTRHIDGNWPVARWPPRYDRNGDLSLEPQHLYRAHRRRVPPVNSLCRVLHCLAFNFPPGTLGAVARLGPTGRGSDAEAPRGPQELVSSERNKIFAASGGTVRHVIMLHQ